MKLPDQGADFSRRANRTCFDSIQQSLTTITNSLNNPQIQQSSATVTITSRGLAGTNQHIADLHTKIQWMTAQITNPLLRSSLDSHIKDLVQQSVADFKDNGEASHHDRQQDKDYSQIHSDSSSIHTVKPLGRKRICWETHCSTNHYFFGTVIIHSRTYRVPFYSNKESYNTEFEDRYEFETSLILRPPPWLLKFGLNTGIKMELSRSIRGWKHTLNPLRTVPDDSLIFEFCNRGNIHGVRLLFARGQASPWDTDSKGCTPLHVSIRSHPQIRLYLSCSIDIAD